MFGFMHKFLRRFFSESSVDTFLIRSWCLFKIKLIQYVKVSIIQADEKAVIVDLPLNYRTRNHLGSMYLGALVTGAETGPVFYAIKQTFLNRILVNSQYSSMKGDFLKRVSGKKVRFICQDSARIKEGLIRASKSDERVYETVTVEAYDMLHDKGSVAEDSKVASFSFTITMRRPKPKNNQASTPGSVAINQ